MEEESVLSVQEPAPPGQKKPPAVSLFKLFAATFKVGMFTFGGGYAMVPLMAREFSENNHWISEEEILDVLAVSQSLPGAIAINTSVMVGYRLAGIKGAAAATVGSALPSLMILSVIGMMYTQFKENPYVAAALRGVRASVVALMIQAVLKLGKPSLKEAWNWIFFAGALLLSLLTGLHIVVLIAGTGLLSWILRGRKARE